MNEEFAIHWFRQDLRLNDNPSLNYLSKNHKNIVCLYIYDEVNPERQLGAASKLWLHHSLNDLNIALDNNLLIFKGNPEKIFSEILSNYKIKEISWNRCYEPWRIKRDKTLKIYLKENTSVNSFNGSLLWEPWDILKNDGSPYKVFTPFYQRGCLKFKEPKKPENCKLKLYNHKIKSTDINELELNTNRTWGKNIIKHWKIGESHAEELMNTFFLSGIQDYSEGRNFPNKKNVSRLSPYLHWGQISPNTLWHKALELEKKIDDKNIEIFKSELGWREFFYSLMYHFPKIQNENLQKKFDKFPWESNDHFFSLWKKGLTGYPIVDAGMRELYETGWMHNRIRMVVGSFLVKHLRINWTEGEKHFRNCLLDFNKANNVAQWQWVAGCGADAAPYFRIFNPILQGEKFDKEGKYVKKWVPELNKVPQKFIHKPWEMEEKYQQAINTIVGKDYPKPIVIHEEARASALKAFQSLKKN